MLLLFSPIGTLIITGRYKDDQFYGTDMFQLFLMYPTVAAANHLIPLRYLVQIDLMAVQLIL